MTGRDDESPPAAGEGSTVSLPDIPPVAGTPIAVNGDVLTIQDVSTGHSFTVSGGSSGSTTTVDWSYAEIEPASPTSDLSSFCPKTRDHYHCDCYYRRGAPARWRTEGVCCLCGHDDTPAGPEPRETREPTRRIVVDDV